MLKAIGPGLAEAVGMGAFRGKWMIYGLKGGGGGGGAWGWGICRGYNFQLGYIGAIMEAVFVHVKSIWGLMWANVRYEG